MTGKHCSHLPLSHGQTRSSVCSSSAETAPRFVQRKSSIMAQPWIVGLVWLICSSITLCESVPHIGCNHRQLCMERMYDNREAVCCEGILHEGQGLSCCGKQPFDPARDTCCQEGGGSTLSANVTWGVSETVSDCCGLEAYNRLNHICCQSAIVAKPVAMAQCCGKEAFDADKYLCCGLPENKTILRRNSTYHRCCGREQFDNRTQCCCNDLRIHSIQSNCCASDLSCGPPENKTILRRNSTYHRCCGHEQFDIRTQCCCDDLQIHSIQSNRCISGLHSQTPILQPNCTEPHTHLCGSSCYNPHEFQCCEIQNTTRCYKSGVCDAVPTVYDPHSQVCCHGCLSKKEPWMHQFHGSHGQHCCGIETYRLHDEICCDGHRHPKREHTHCCGIHVYDIKDLRMKCCAGSLYNLTHLGSYREDVQCCEAILQMPKNQDVCCSSVDKEVLYSKETGFRCCGHRYYNTSLWSCCAENLSPLHQPGQAGMNDESRYLSVNNLKTEEDLCKEMYIGTVLGLSLLGVEFHGVLKIHAANATVQALPSPYILKTPNRCNKPKLIPGRTYFFDEVHVFTGFKHDPLQSLHSIISKCHHLTIG